MSCSEAGEGSQGGREGGGGGEGSFGEREQWVATVLPDQGGGEGVQVWGV